MKNRFLGITAFLAVVVLSFVFTVSCGPGEDTTITFTNGTCATITVVTDAGNVELIPAVLNPSVPIPSQTVTKKGDITISNLSAVANAYGISESNWLDYIELNVNTVAANGKQKPNKGVKFGSGTISFIPRITNDDGDTFGSGNIPANPAIPK